MSGERHPGVVEDDPEYDGDAAADVDTEAIGFAPDDPAAIAADQGDAGQAAVPEGVS
jgi:hypothetical protein